MGMLQQFLLLFQHLPDVHFFAKDCDGRFIASGTGILQRLAFRDEKELIGLSDAEIHPALVAQKIRLDDLRVMKTREPLIDRPESLFTHLEAKNWYLITKLPIIDPHDEVIGIMGFLRPYEPERLRLPGAERLVKAVKHIHHHHEQALTIAELSGVANLSERQLRRLFQAVFATSPQEFIVRTRVQAAIADLLESDKPLSVIAHNHGFYDQSSFSRQFSQHTGETPRVFRQRRNAAPAAGFSAEA